MNNPYFFTQSKGPNTSLVLINDHKAYDYIFEVMNKNFGFENKVLQHGANADGAFFIELEVSQQVLDRHLDHSIVEYLTQVVYR